MIIFAAASAVAFFVLLGFGTYQLSLAAAFEALLLSYLSKNRYVNICLVSAALFFIFSALFVIYKGQAIQNGPDLTYYFVKKAAYFNNAEAYGVLKAIATGRRDFLSAEMKDIFSSTGSYHLIAISGLHFGIVFSLFNKLLKKVPYNIRLIILAAVMTIYLILTDYYVSAVRAYLMVLIYLGGKYLKKPVYPLNVWAIAGVVMICLYPGYIERAGFWLSMTATLFIMLSLNVVRKMKTFVAQAFTVTTAAQAGVLPLLFKYFGQYNLLSPFLNIFALIFIYPLVCMGLFLLFPLPAFVTQSIVWMSEKIIIFFKFYLEIFNDDRFIVHFTIGWKEVALWYVIIFVSIQVRSIYKQYALLRGKGV